ncbi:bifunctional helix-turn-helix transcriptional regulator/GNAT family N-acetyltransferase [Pedobacter antarcticus]|uniref:bifunctional helix-turn-helix transcriptional regulator/GNAT family N-acetyltransferase n=1 Tax=Pedobacter antarcticus TaxID=34086 RepID=UPI0008809B9B|nr:bifunctional helix-turn-helix transcriptional regulator/GNAT family N-acetyltransferase [Pedobacter antarcticus]SDM59155.1 DNA-binding transcriptional regulator, MarR family [Pedobacter antarcticus]
MKNIIDDAGILAIGTRLLRIHDLLRAEGNSFYKTQGIEFETKWFPVLYVLSVKSPLGIMDLAQQIGLSHPALIALLKELEKRDLVDSVKDTRDERKRNMFLTEKGSDLVHQLRPIWTIIESVLVDLTENTNNLLKALNETEEKLKESSFLQRAEAMVKEKLAKNESPQIITVKLVSTAEEQSIVSAIIKQELAIDYPSVSRNNNYYYLAFINGIPAGSAVLSATKENQSVFDLAVLPSYQNKGLEIALSNAIEAKK